MDPLTHSLTGAALGETGLRRAGALATPTLVLAANVPDIDIFAYVAGSDAALLHRRGWTHGPIGLVVLPLLVAAIMIGIDRWRHRRSPGDRHRMRPMAVLGLAYLGALTHPALDWLNTYGVRFLMPFDADWHYGDALFIVDPWLWLLLGGGVYWSHCARGGSRGRMWATLAFLAVVVVLLGPASSAATGLRVLWILLLSVVVVGRRLVRSPRAGSRLAAAALLVASGYAVTMASLSATAGAAVRHQLAQWGTAASSVMAGPVPLRPFDRILLAAAPDGYRSGSYRVGRRPPLLLDREPRDTLPIELIRSPVIARAWADPSIRGFRTWARFPTATLETGEDGTTVYFLDLRYTDRPTRGFGGAVVELDQPRSPGEAQP